MATNVKASIVVKYNNKYYVLFGFTKNGNCKLLGSNGLIYSGTPHPDQVTFVKELDTVKYNGHHYILTKQGVFSCSTGKFTLYEPIITRFQIRYSKAHLAKLWNNELFTNNANVYHGRVA